MASPDRRDPSQLEAAEVAPRTRALQDRLRAMGMSAGGVDPNCPPEIHEQFLHSVLGFETAAVGRRFDGLVARGCTLPHPDSLDGAAVTVKLWQVIRALAADDVYLVHTDHLSDRDLYRYLWAEGLREEIPLFPPGSGWRDFIDPIGGGSDEDIQVGLRYYDDELTRCHWAKVFPDLAIPARQTPPFDRDRFLPRPPEEG